MDFNEALEDAVKNNQAKPLLLLLSVFPDQVGPKLKSTHLLHEAIINNALNIIPILLDHGADIDGCLNTKCNVTQAVDVTVLELLLSRGADPNVKIGSRLHTHPIHFFVSCEFKVTLWKRWWSLPSPEFLNLFLNSEIKDFVKCLVKHGAQVDLRDGRGQTALHVAAREGHSVSILQFLVDNGADVNATNHLGQTPLWNAVHYGNADYVQSLIENGADINLVCKSTGKSMLFEAKHKIVLEILLDNGVDVKTIDGECPLNSLLAECHIGTENVKRLIKAGCDVNNVNKDGDTVLIHATKYVDRKLLELLVQEGADVNASGNDFPYYTAITTMLIKLWKNAARTTSCINYLLNNNANIDNVNPSVIHVFITSGCFSPIPKFIDRGIAPECLSIEMSAISRLRSKTIITPLMMALLLNQSELARYFIKINYLMKSDIDILYGKGDSQLLCEEASASNSLDLLKTFSKSPLSLETLCFVVISDTLSHTQDRRLNVQKLGIPQPTKDLFLFKNATDKDKDIPNMGTRNLLLFKYSLEQLNLYQIDSDDEDGEDTYFDSD